MVREDGPDVDSESALLCEVGEARDEISPVSHIPEDDAGREPPCHHVVERSVSIEARLAGHNKARVAGGEKRTDGLEQLSICPVEVLFSLRVQRPHRNTH